MVLTIRGVHLPTYCVMHKCIMVKTEGKKKYVNDSKTQKLNESRGKFIKVGRKLFPKWGECVNSVEIGGEILADKTQIFSGKGNLKSFKDSEHFSETGGNASLAEGGWTPLLTIASSAIGISNRLFRNPL